MNSDIVQTLIRSVLKFGAAWLVTKGFANDSQAQELVGAIAGIIGVLWGIWHRSAPPAASQPAQSQPGPSQGTLGKLLNLLLLVGLISCCSMIHTGCKSTLAIGGAYAPGTNGISTTQPDLAFYLTDSSYDVAYAALEAAFKFERDNRPALWSLSPIIKQTLDKIRPTALQASNEYLLARAAYMANPVPANLSGLQTALAKMQQLTATAIAILPKGN